MNHYEDTREFAKRMDDEDSLASFRNEFNFPREQTGIHLSTCAVIPSACSPNAPSILSSRNSTTGDTMPSTDISIPNDRG